MMKNIALLVCLLSWALSSHAVLLGRLPDENGNFQAYYDTDADLTWLADADFMLTSGYSISAFATWDVANAWATGLDVDGVTGWRLPETVSPDPGCSNPDWAIGWGCTGSEMGNFYINVLGGKSSSNDNSDDFNANYDLFSNVDIYSVYGGGLFWSGTKVSPEWIWVFDFKITGGQQYQEFSHSGGGVRFRAWAVHDGDVGLVPLPAAVWLFGSGLIGLIGLARRRVHA